VSFEKAIALVLKREGGYLSPEEALRIGDRGGETKYGISKRAYPEVDIKNLTKEQATEIYRKDYWEQVHGDAMPWPLSFFVFDSAVNQGTHAAIRMAQQSLGITDDGIVGPQTLSVMSGAREWHAAKFMAIRAARYAKSSDFDKFGQGWLIRLFQNALEAK